MSHETTAESSSGHAVLMLMRISLHVAFATLLMVGLIRMFSVQGASPRSLAAAALAGLLAALYLAGTLVEKRNAAGHGVLDATDTPGERGRRISQVVRGIKRYTLVWLGAVTLLWLLLLLLSADFSWVAFPLFFLHLHVLPRRAAVAVVVLLTAAVVLAQWAQAAALQLPMVLGPSFGAAFAVVMATVYRSLLAEAAAQRRAVAELRRLQEELLAAQHEAGVLAERERLARDIHDTLAQGLSSIVLISRAAESSLAAGQPDLTLERLQTIQAAASENLAEARSFVRGVHGPDPAAGALASRIRQVCLAVQRSAAAAGTPVEVRFRAEGEPEVLAGELQEALVRAAQSTLANVFKHSGAATAVVTLAFMGPEVSLDVYDDGRGFDPSRVAAAPERTDGTGYGLPQLRARIMSLGGGISVDSTPGEGTVVGIRLPVTPASQLDLESTPHA